VSSVATVDRADEYQQQPPRRWVRWMLLAVVLGIVAMWVYAFAFAPREGVYLVTDDSWRASAEEICAVAEARRDALADTDGGYIDQPTPAQMAQRAEIVDQATDIVEEMLDDVVALPLSGDKDQLRVEVFAEHYRTLIADRRAYAEDLRTGENRAFHESMVEGGPVANVLTDFTSGNDIDSCAPPFDL
jgi:hypothetical protein